MTTGVCRSPVRRHIVLLIAVRAALLLRQGRLRRGVRFAALPDASANEGNAGGLVLGRSLW